VTLAVTVGVLRGFLAVIWPLRLAVAADAVFLLVFLFGMPPSEWW
jgi:hypothetical protein